MPAGSDYAGPPAALDHYRSIVDTSATGDTVKGAKNPYTSRNGHMYSFLDPTGLMALRLSDELRDQFAQEYEAAPVEQYGSVMRGYVAIPEALRNDADELRTWLERSHDWIGTLEPK